MKGTIVLIHGMWCGPEHWARYRDYFARSGWRVITPTLRHHGGGGAGTDGLGTTSLLDYAADLEGEIRALGDRPILVGHSMGGLLAQILASRGVARAVALLAPAAPWGIVPLRPSVVRSFLSLLLRRRFWRRPHLPTPGEAAYALLNGLPPAERDRVYGSLRPESGRAIAEVGLWWFDPARASAVDEGRVRCPMIVFQGLLDRITPPAVTRRVSRKYRAEHRELPGRAHWLLSEPGWEALCADLEGWAATAG